jgi:hypothetical protein
MKVFWNDCGRGLESESAKEVDLEEAGLIWSDEVHGVKGNFFGLIDDDGNTILARLATPSWNRLRWMP